MRDRKEALAMTQVRRLSRWSAGSRLCLAAFMGFFALAKLLSGHDDSYNVSVTLYYTIMSLELIVMVALVFGLRVVTASAVCVVLFAMGLIWVSTIGPGCGCAGKFMILDKSTHVLVGSFGGVLAAATIQLHS